MKQVGYIVASCMILVGSVLSAGCPCAQKKRQEINKPKSDEQNVSFTLAGCPCNQNKPRQALPKPLQPSGENVSFVLADCPCRKPRQTPPKPLQPSGDNVSFVLAGCGCQKNKPNEERVQRKPMPIKEKQEVYGLMAEMANQNKRLVGGKNAPSSPSGLNIQQKGLFSFFKASPFPVVTHFVRETDPKGNIITIQDGTVWSVSEKDRDIAKTWRVHDEITVKPNSLTLWQKLTGKKNVHEYRLMNLQTNETVAVNMSLGPFKYNPNRRVIETIDLARGEIFLNDKTLWKIEPSDPARQILRSWKKGHTIICGTNDTWFSLGSPFILISVDTDNWIPATRIN